MNRRNFIIGAIAAPAIVKAEILMPVTMIWTPRMITYYLTMPKQIAAITELLPYQLEILEAIKQRNAQLGGGRPTFLFAS